MVQFYDAKRLYLGDARSAAVEEPRPGVGAG